MRPTVSFATPAFTKVIAISLAFLSLYGCATKTPSSEVTAVSGENSGVQTTKERRFLGIFAPYRVDIQQGNFVSREMVAQLKEKMKSPEGMTQSQVQFVMGTPLVSDIFHADRWDYAFRLEKDNGDVITSHISVYFKDNKLSRLEGGDLPNEREYLSLIAGKSGTTSMPKPVSSPVPPK
jgi:outer membrane protein assembly factor BamE